VLEPVKVLLELVNERSANEPSPVNQTRYKGNTDQCIDMTDVHVNHYKSELTMSLKDV